MSGLSGQCQYLKFFINLDLNTDVASTGVFGVHIELENGAVFLVSRGHEGKAPHFVELFYRLLVEIVLVLEVVGGLVAIKIS